VEDIVAREGHQIILCKALHLREAVGLRGQDLLEEVAHAARVAEHHTVGVLIVDEVLDVLLRYEWIWYKERGTGFLNANRAPLKKSENILVFYQKSPVYNPQFTYGKPYTRVHSRSGTSSNYGKFERQGSESNDGRRYPGNVLFVPTVSGGIHPTQKPVELCEYLIRTYTRPGELVADICAGSGTTAIAAINTERRFVCFETAPAFYAAASERIRAAQAVKSSGEKGV